MAWAANRDAQRQTALMVSQTAASASLERLGGQSSPLQAWPAPAVPPLRAPPTHEAQTPATLREKLRLQRTGASAALRHAELAGSLAACAASPSAAQR